MRLVDPQTIESILQERLRVRLDLQNISKQSLPLEQWWGSATAEQPRLAYELFVDAVRLAVDLAYTRDGDAVGLYAGKAYGDERRAFRFLVDFLVQAKRQKLMPHWWNPQHELCMLRLSFDKNENFCIYHAVEVADIRKKWGYKTTKLLMALFDAVYGEDGIRNSRDELLGGAMSLVIGHTPSREIGHGKGKDILCRWGDECKRRDCWFKHPRLHLDESSGDCVAPNSTSDSTTNLRDHLLHLTGSRDTLLTLYNWYHDSLGIVGLAIERRRPVSPSQQLDSQRRLREKASEGNSFAQYLLGKLWKESDIPVFGKYPSAAKRSSETCKLYTAAALAGNAYAMAGLALVHRDAGHMPTAVHWWLRALEHVEFPEAAYDLAVAYGMNETVGSDAVPINYEQAAMFYARVVDMDLGYLKMDSAPNDACDEELELFTHVLWESPSNNDQVGFQPLAVHNLYTMERYLGNPSSAPIPNNPELPPFVVEGTDASLCMLCGRIQREGEKAMMKCSRCHVACYCNAICQRGHWPSHKPECS